MNRYIEYIIDYDENRLTPAEREVFDIKLKNNQELREEFTIFKQFNTYIRGRFDLDEVRNDPGLNEIDSEIGEAVDKYNSDPGKYLGERSFVNENSRFIESDGVMDEEINHIKREIRDYKVDKLTEVWVAEWLQKKENQKAVDPTTESIKNYITRSFKTGQDKNDLKVIYRQKNEKKLKVLIYQIGLAAAVLASGFLLLKFILFSGDPGKLYDTYYSRFDAITPVTRNQNSTHTNLIRQGVDWYNAGNYLNAASAFSMAYHNDTSLIAPRFLEGMCRLELGEFNEALSSLSYVISHSDEYKKESLWYLGLAYLKTGETGKATACFELLAGHDGYYQKKAKKLLRSLK